MLFFYQKNGHEFGPLTEREFLVRLRSNEIGPAMRVRTDGLDWMNLEAFLQSGALEKFAAEKQAAEQARADIFHAVAFSSQPLANLPEKFGSPMGKAQVYADYLEKLFPLDGPPGPCTIYRNSSVTERATFHWLGQFYESGQYSSSFLKTVLLFIFGWHALLLPKGDTRPDSVAFRTVHDFSAQAASEQRSNWIWSRLCWWLGGLILGLVVLGAVPLLAILVMAMDSSYSAGERAKNVSLLINSLGVLLMLTAIAWALLARSRVFRLPPALRTLEKRPFQLSKITWESLT